MPRPFETPVIRRTRNTNIFSGNGEYLGGAWLNVPAHITNEEFYSMCEHFICFPGEHHRWQLRHLGPNNEFGARVGRDTSDIQTGRYVVLGNNGQIIGVSLKTERAVRRLRSSPPSSSRLGANQRHFRDTLLHRDGGKCVITGMQGPEEAPMRGLRASHIFPVARLSLWIDKNYEAWITDQTDGSLIGPRKLFSAQNGLLLSATIHDWFDAFDIAINPDKGYRTVVFVEDPQGLGGLDLSPTTRNCSSDERVSDECLRWHYHQAVLTHMRGEGEEIWDFDDNTMDDMGMMMEYEEAELLELEFGNRLGPFVEDDVAN